MNPLRSHKSYFAFVGHRLSGLALAAFLPVHFLLLGSALDGAEGLDKFLVYTDLPLVKAAEWGLVMLLALHLLFGVRLLLLEFTRWPSANDSRTGWIIPSIVVAFFVGVVFWLQVLWS